MKETENTASQLVRTGLFACTTHIEVILISKRTDGKVNWSKACLLRATLGRTGEWTDNFELYSVLDANVKV